MTDTDERAETISRPAGRPYRARKTPTAQVLVNMDDEPSGVLVLRTHDIDRAARLAEQLWWQATDCQLPAGKTCWQRFVPWGGDSGSYEVVAPDVRNAVPCVWFGVDAP